MGEIVNGKPEKMAAIKKALSKPITTAALAKKVNMPFGTVKAYIHALRKQKLIFVQGWISGRPIYQLGNEPDAIKPVKTRQQRNAEYTARIKADPKKKAKHLARLRKWHKKRMECVEYRLDCLVKSKRYKARKAPVKPDPFLAQFDGLFRRAA
jgi:hypothetical protein